MPRIKTCADIERFLDQLVELDPALVAVREVAGPLPLRLSSPNFAGLADIVVSQHVSKVSAAAIFGRLKESTKPLTAKQFVFAADKSLVEVGLTRAKQQTLKAIAGAIVDGTLDLALVSKLPVGEAIARLTKFKGVGPWTAEVFLLFCAGHVDLFPSKDVALQTALGDALGIEPRPSSKGCEKIAERWTPFRGVAARLFWEYYAKRKQFSRTLI